MHWRHSKQMATLFAICNITSLARHHLREADLQTENKDWIPIATHLIVASICVMRFTGKVVGLFWADYEGHLRNCSLVHERQFIFIDLLRGWEQGTALRTTTLRP